MKQIMIIVAVLAVVALLCSVFFFGIIPSLGLFDTGTDTISYRRGVDEWAGNYQYELFDQKGYILSYKTDGFSEKITIRGKIDKWNNELPWSSIDKVMYYVFLKKNVYSPYELLSQTGSTSKYFSSENPGEIIPPNPSYPGYVETYGFNLVGNDYATGAIKVQFYAYYDLTPWDGSGKEWQLMAVDEAYLYSGYGGLYLPTGIEDGIERPYSTFEIGQTVKIGVETAKGGHSISEKNWRVTLNAPYSGSIDNPDTGGGVTVEQYFPDDCDPSNSFFEFVVTSDMATKSMNSAYPFTVRIWNTLLPLGTLQIDFVDFLRLCPSNVDFEGSEKVQVNTYATVKVKATVNSETQAAIDYIRIAVIYGTNDVLLPGDFGSPKWLIHTTNAGDADKKSCTLPLSISFMPAQEGYVTVHAKAFDIEGRCSKTTRTFTLYAWQSQSEGGNGEPPDSATEEETGDHDYGGGHTDPWTPWDPSQGNWEDKPELKIDFTGIIIAIAIIAGFLVLAFLIPGLNMFIRVSIIIVGIAIAIIQYLYFFI